MIGSYTVIPEPSARWASRSALSAAGLVVITLILHRLFSFPTPVALNMFVVAFAGAGLAILLGVFAVARIWTKGRSGAWAAATGIIFGGLVLLWPLAHLSTFRSLPRINDITTDWVSPPRFVQLARARGDGANRLAYPGEAFARQQIAAYPDIRPLVVDRSVEEIYDVVLETMRGRRGMGWKVLAEDPPTLRPAKPGVIEASERTLVLGFTDDIVVRISGDDKNARIDVRSVSRFGQHDLGANASRVRRFTRELQTRLETFSPFGVAGRGGVRGSRAMQSGAGQAVPRRPQERSSAPVGSQSKRDPAPTDTRRAPPPIEKPRG